MQKGIIAALCIAAAAFIGYVGFNAWIAFVDWRNRRGPARFKPRCRVLEWQAEGLAFTLPGFTADAP